MVRPPSTPAFATRGVLVALTAGLFGAAGVVHVNAWPLVALAAVIVSALCTAYIAFFSVSIYLRRRKVELAWSVPPGDQPGGALTAEHPFHLNLILRNSGYRPLRVNAIKVFGSQALDLPEVSPAIVPAGREVEIVSAMRAKASGYWVLHGAQVTLADALGLFVVRAYFPNPLGLKVFPKLSSPRADQVVIRPTVGALHERVGVHTIRRRGLAGDLREIRDHAHGDPFKFIAWKATARRRRLMVRELESEIVVTHQVLVDVAGSMRAGEHGRTKLDWSIETAAALARAALDGGDRFGMVTFDTRVYGQVKPGEGRPHYLTVIDRLLETKNVVDGDLTDVTDGELVAAVARYLLNQEAIDVRLPAAPPLSDPAWATIAAGPGGELYDMTALGRIVKELLGNFAARLDARRVDRSAPSWWSRAILEGGPAADLARLRAFCRVRGIELPYRATPEFGRRSVGLGEAVRHATASERSQFVVLISDLEGLLDDPGPAMKAIALARRRHHHILAVAPFAPLFAAKTTTVAGLHASELLAADERRRLEGVRRRLTSHGVPVIVAGPDDLLPVLARKIARARMTLRA